MPPCGLIAKVDGKCCRGGRLITTSPLVVNQHAIGDFTQHMGGNDIRLTNYGSRTGICPPAGGPLTIYGIRECGVRNDLASGDPNYFPCRDIRNDESKDRGGIVDDPTLVVDAEQ